MVTLGDVATGKCVRQEFRELKGSWLRRCVIAVNAQDQQVVFEFGQELPADPAGRPATGEGNCDRLPIANPLH